MKTNWSDRIKETGTNWMLVRLVILSTGVSLHIEWVATSAHELFFCRLCVDNKKPFQVIWMAVSTPAWTNTRPTLLHKGDRAFAVGAPRLWNDLLISSFTSLFKNSFSLILFALWHLIFGRQQLGPWGPDMGTVADSRLAQMSQYVVWTGSWRGASSPPENCLDALK